jgi:hypothetical protein
MLPSHYRRQFRIFGGINITTFFILLFAYGIALLVFPSGKISPMTPLIILFFTLINLVMFYAKLRIIHSDNARFINLFLIFNSLKIVFFIAIIVLYAFFFRDDALSFAISFFVCYVIYTIILVRSFNKIQKP